MRSLPWIKIGAVAALWTIIAGAAVSGWMLGKREAAREYSDLQRRLTAGDTPTRSCGIEVDLLDSEGRGKALPSTPADAGPTQISAPPGFYHLREMLTLR